MLVTLLPVVGFTITAVVIDIIVAIIVALVYIFVPVFVFIVIVNVKNVMVQVFKVLVGLVDTILHSEVCE